MISAELLTSNISALREMLVKRGEDPSTADQALLAKESRNQLQSEVETLRAKAKTDSATPELARTNHQELVRLKQRLSALEPKLALAEISYQEKISRLPNLLAPDVPTGKSEKDNRVLDQWGEIKLPTGRAHQELMTDLDWLDLETAAQTSGTRFRYLKGPAAIAHWRLFQSALNLAISKGFTPVVPPVIIKSDGLEAAGFFPRGQEDTFALTDGRWLVGTSEPMLLALAQGQTFSRDDLPLRYVAYSTCFRGEAGSYGKDTKGMFRVHQFDKVEMVSISTSDQSDQELQFLVSIQEEMIRSLQLPYQKVLLSSADQTPIAAKQIDLETWFPSQERYRETHSASNCWDYQSRELKIKVKDDLTPEFAHTLNATVATERLLLAVIENNQLPNGRVEWPKILRP